MSKSLTPYADAAREALKRAAAKRAADGGDYFSESKERVPPLAADITTKMVEVVTMMAAECLDRNNDREDIMNAFQHGILNAIYNVCGQVAGMEYVKDNSLAMLNHMTQMVNNVPDDFVAYSSAPINGHRGGGNA